MGSAREEAFGVVRSGDLNRLAALLSADPSLVGARDAGGLSLLLFACYCRRADMVELIRAAGLSPDIFEAAAVPGASGRGAELLEADPGLATVWSSDGFTALHLASYFGNEEMADFLLGRGADPDAVSRNRSSLRPLHSAASSRSVGIAKKLLEHGAEVDARQQGGHTPLHSAANNGDLPMVELLLAGGADPGLASDDGKTALDLAVERDHAGVADLLRARAAGQEGSSSSRESPSG